MIWRLEWGPLVYRDVLHLPWRTAGELCATVMDFAKTGRGPVSRVSRHEPQRLKLVVTGAVALMNADPASGVLLVTRTFRRQ